MSEYPINITLLNDFIFCPASIYFHYIDSEADDMMIKSEYQINGSAAHSTVDNSQYSSSKNILQGISLYCEKYALYGKIDMFNISEGVLTERKKKIKNIYDGYIFQVYAEYFALLEMGYKVNEIRLYSMDDNRVYSLELPEQNSFMLEKFENTLLALSNFKLENFRQENAEKCNRCIYRPLCSYDVK